MAKAPSRKLKVFQAQFGFYDSVVAAPSQAAALRAWDTHQNLFASGEARIVTDEGAVKAAMAHPEVPLRRAVGSRDPFALDPAGLPELPRVAKRLAPKKARSAPTKSPPADRSKLEAAEAALRNVDERRKAEEARFRREEADLESRKSAAQGAYVEARKSATGAVVAAREAYRKAGGTD